MEDLIKKAKSGDKLAFTELMLQMQDELYKIAKIRLKNDDDVFDVIQDTMLSAYKSLKKLKHNEYFKTWIIKILINECNKIHRQNKKIIYLENYNQTDLVYNDKYDDFEKLEKIAKLREQGILNYEEYYKIKDLKSKTDIFGVEVVKTEYLNENIRVEKAAIDKLTNDEKIENSILDILKRNEVTPVILEDVIEDLVKC